MILGLEVDLYLVNVLHHVGRFEDIDVLGVRLFRFLVGGIRILSFEKYRATAACDTIRSEWENVRFLFFFLSLSFCFLRTFVSSVNDSISDPIEIVALDSRESGV